MANGSAVLLRHVAVAVIYGAAYVYLRNESFRHWVPLIGLRLSCLLLLPYRYWPSLLIGEMAPMTYSNFLCLDTLGISWVIAASVPPILLMMPIVRYMEKQLPGLQAPVAQRMSAFLTCSTLASTVLTINGLIDYSLAKLAPGEQPVPMASLGGQYFLGVFLGILVITPIALLSVRAACHAGSFLGLLKRAMRSRFVVESLVVLIAIAGLVSLGGKANDEVWRQATLVALFVPVILFALRHGWQGSAIAGAAANVGIIILMPAKSDPSTLLAQSIMALALITFLMLGARTSVMRQSLRETSRSLQQARDEIYANEMTKRHSAKELEQLHALLNMTHMRLLHRLQYFMTPGESEAHREQLSDLRRQFHRLADGLSPKEWQRMGGHPGALWSGPIVGVLSDLGVRCEVDPGGQMSLVAPDIAMALYRLSCEVVVHLLLSAPTSHLRLSTTTSEQVNALRVEVNIEGLGEAIAPPPREKLLLGLGAIGLTEADMRKRAKLFAGDLLVEQKSDRLMRVTIHLSDLTESGALEMEEAA